MNGRNFTLRSFFLCPGELVAQFKFTVLLSLMDLRGEWQVRLPHTSQRKTSCSQTPSEERVSSDFEPIFIVYCEMEQLVLCTKCGVIILK